MRSDAPGLGEQDVAPVGLADVAHRPEAVGHVFGACGVLVGAALETVHGDAFALPGDEDLDHAFADADVDFGADMAFGRGVVVALDSDMAVGSDLAFDPFAPFPGVPGQGLESGPLAGLEEVTPGRAACHRRLVQLFELAPDRGVHGVQREEGLMTQREQDTRLDDTDGGLDGALVGGSPLACRKHGEIVVFGELAEAGVELGILAVRPGDAGLEVVDDPALGTAAERLQRPAVGHRPVSHALVGYRLGVDQVRMRQHGHEDLHILIAAAAPEAQGLAREVGHAIEARRRSRSAPAPARAVPAGAS